MAPRSAAQFDEIRQRSRANIMEVALELFATHGYQGTSISKIATKAGVSKGLLYNYFDNKQDLLDSILIDTMEQNMAWCEEMFTMEASPYEKLQFAIEKAISVVQDDTHHWRLLTALTFQPDILKGVEDVIAEKQAELFPKMIEIFAELGVEDPTKEAWLYAAQMDGMFMHYMNMQDQYPLEEMKEFILAKYKKYI